MARTVVLLLALFLLSAAAALPARAAQADVNEVTARLNTMLAAGIDPNWPGDVEANTALVESMLAAFERCTPAERASFSEEQKTNLRAYFETYYGLSGRDTAGLDALFAGEDVSQSRPPASSAPASSAPEEDSSSAASQSASEDPSSSQSTGPLPSTSGAVPGADNGPQVPGSGGIASFFGSGGLAPLLIVVLAILALIVFIRFLAANSAAKREAAAEAPTQEGEADGQQGEREKGPSLPFALNQPVIEESSRENRRRQRRERKAAKKAGRSPAAPDDEPLLDDAHLWSSTPEEASLWDDPLAAAAAGGTFEAPAAPPQPPAAEDPTLAEEGNARLKPITPPAGAQKDAAPPKPKRTRRTGRPKRMPFRVGDEHDIDGIDD